MLQQQLKGFVTHIADTEDSRSWSSRFRGKRFAFFKQLLQTLDLPLNILDVGGRETVWKKEFFGSKNPAYGIHLTILNITETPTTHPNIKSAIGDARNMQQYRDHAFDIVFSNSVIEHVGEYRDQQQMADEVKRIGKRYFLQTPNRYFPIEPHFLFPFFQFLPLSIKIWLIRHFALGWRPKTTDRIEAAKLAKSVRLMTKKELKQLFPAANIYEEKFLGLTKSFIVYEGW